jgi:hypothetical protein
MLWDLTEVLSESGDKIAAQGALDAQRGYFPHAVNRLEFRLRDWFGMENADD